MDATDDDALSLSALNHYAYCPRRCALIHLDQEFEDNVHTQRGNREHERADQVGHDCPEPGVRVEYALPVWSRRLGLSGRCDAVEFRPDGAVYPVEYKHGARKKWLNDDLQLAAQALCLEEMTGRPVPRGAIFHQGSRRRREVVIGDDLRRAVAQAVTAIRALLAAGHLPPPVHDGRCRECSLHDICAPEAVAGRERAAALRRALFDVEEDQPPCNRS